MEKPVLFEVNQSDHISTRKGTLPITCCLVKVFWGPRCSTLGRFTHCFLTNTIFQFDFSSFPNDTSVCFTVVKMKPKDSIIQKEQDFGRTDHCLVLGSSIFVSTFILVSHKHDQQCSEFTEFD
eukprot:TRINITY_DN1169_c0_g1_i2.p1 TRINITY_DN1169_c0_g1~~TRINITY_DN1169_c0_g1_i2.p1  ORF type:complete len:123 (+),score=5.21 TRINITY_DN1169_c0_g1_i2:80-448(+)